MNHITATTLRLPIHLLNNLKEIAKSKGLTLNALLLQILWDWINQRREENEHTRSC